MKEKYKQFVVKDEFEKKRVQKVTLRVKKVIEKYSQIIKMLHFKTKKSYWCMLKSLPLLFLKYLAYVMMF